MSEKENKAMKRAIAIILAALLLLPLTACRGKGQAPAEVTDTDAPSAASDASDPQTDYANLYGGLTQDDIVETEDAFYWHQTDNDYLYYCDKASGESGVLCPRPECEHDAVEHNTDCSGYIGNTANPSLSYYRGKLYWIGYYGYTMRNMAVFCMDPDGTNREKVRDITPEHDYYGYKYYFHRGYIYYYRLDSVVEGGKHASAFTVARVPIDSEELETIYYTKSHYVILGTLRFRGDETFIYIRRDNGDENTEPEEVEDLKTYIEILRWTPGMAEAECYCRIDDAQPMINTNAFSITADGSMYFETAAALTAPDTDEELEYKVCRLDPDGKVTELFGFEDEETKYYINCITDSAVIAKTGSASASFTQPVWIKDLNGETLFKGDIPLDIGSDSLNGQIASAGIRILSVSRDSILGVVVTRYGTEEKNTHYRLVNYTITDAGAVPAVLCES